MNKKLLVLISLFFISITQLLSQAPRGEFRTVNIINNFDTLIVDRTLSDWWFGISGGVSGALSFGDLVYPDAIEGIDVLSTKKIHYKPGTGFGGYAGLYGEWLPIDGMFGAYLRLNLFDQRTSEADGEKLNDSAQTKFDSKYTLNYISISPGVRYNLPIENLYLNAGLDIDINTSYLINVFRHRVNPEPIVDEMRMPYDPNSIRLGINFGIGYDIFIVDMYNFMRSYISPHLSVHIGTKEISTFNSSRIPFIAKAGINFKFNIDHKKYDTLLLDVDYIEPPRYIASYKKELGVEFGGFQPEERLFAALREVPEKEKIEVVAQMEPEIKKEETVKVTPKEEPQKKNIVINPNQTRIFYYPSSEGTNLTKVQREYLDELINYLNKNPNATVRISGHSDNAGTTVQNQQRSERRATNVVQYLTRGGIARRRLLDRGRGALEPIADNTTARGRASNRRVEIQIVR